MMTRASALLLVAAGVALAGDSPTEEAVKKEKDKLIGTWKVVSVEANGQQFPAEATQDFLFIFTAESLTRKRGGNAESGAGYRLDPTKSPKWIDMTGTTDGKEQSVPALYALDRDTLTLCFRTDYKKPDGKLADVRPRPAKLDGGAGSMQVLMHLKRQTS